MDAKVCVRFVRSDEREFLIDGTDWKIPSIIFLPILPQSISLKLFTRLVNNFGTAANNFAVFEIINSANFTRI